jgi:hypothetical protein
MCHFAQIEEVVISDLHCQYMTPSHAHAQELVEGLEQMRWYWEGQKTAQHWMEAPSHPL